MKLLPDRPLKLRITFLVMTFVVAPGALVVAIALVLLPLEGVRITIQQRAILAAALSWWAVSRLRRGITALRVVGNCEETVAELIEVDRSRGRRAQHSLAGEKRRYRFVVHGKHYSLFATSPSARPLFVDEAHEHALALRSPTGTVLFLGADLSPLQLSAEEERAVRDRIEQYRELPESLPEQMR